MVAVVLAAAGAARADRVVIDVTTKAKRGLYPIAVPRPVASDGELAALVTSVQTFDLGVSSWFRVLDPRSFLASLEKEGLGIEPQAWKDIGAFEVIKRSSRNTKAIGDSQWPDRRPPISVKRTIASTPYRVPSTLPPPPNWSSSARE